MLPTLWIGDHIFANLWSYGVPVPFSDWFTEHTSYLGEGELPNRGDIIVFRFPPDPSLFFVKRVIGLPGDMVEVRNKKLFLNGNEVPRHAVPESLRRKIVTPLVSWKPAAQDFEVFEESLSEKGHYILQDPRSLWDQHYPRTQVPDHHLFVMGDNRDHSHDSRHWGFVPLDRVRGRARWIWLSVEDRGEEGLAWHWDRLFKSL